MARSTCLLRPSREMEATASTSSVTRRFKLDPREGLPAVPITNNRGEVFVIKALPFATSQKGVPTGVKSNRGGTDVLGSPQSPATRGALTNIGGGTTNCVEP